MATIQLGNTKVANSLISYCEKREVEKSGVFCIPNYSKEQFKATRELWGKNKGVQAHHIIQSFKPDEVTPKQANEIGKELAEKIAKGHEVVIYTHSDKAHIHNHIVINSVNYEDGSKYQSSKKDLYKIREASDRLCEERGLSVVKEPSAKVRYTLFEKNILEKGQVSWKDEIRQVIDFEKNSSKNYEEFKKVLTQKYNIEVKERGKYISFKHPEVKKFVRGKTLGLDYERGTIEDGFDRQVERTASKERGYTDLSDISREGKEDRKIDDRNSRTQQIDGELYQSSYEREYSNSNNDRYRTREDKENESRDTKQNDFDIQGAREQSERLHRQTSLAYGRWKERDEKEQSNHSGKNGRYRGLSKDSNERDKQKYERKHKRGRREDLELDR